MNGRLTSVGLYTGSDLPSTGVIKVGYILSQDGLEIFFSETFCADFTRVDPDEHVGVGTAEHADAFRKRGGEM